MHNYLPAILDELGGHGDLATTNLDISSLRPSLGSPLPILQVTGVGRLKDRHALIDVVAGIGDVGQLVDVAALGFLAYPLFNLTVVGVVAVVTVEVVAIVGARIIPGVVVGATPGDTRRDIPEVVAWIIPGIAVVRPTLVSPRRGSVVFIISLSIRFDSIALLDLC